jgi:hypothetical protein
MKKWILLILFFWSVNGFAYFTGNDLLQHCNNQVKELNNNGYATDYYNAGSELNSAGICLGFVAGIGDVFTAFKGICPDDDVSYNQISRIVYKYLNSHPEKLNLPAATLVFLAINEAFPCPTKTAEK